MILKKMLLAAIVAVSYTSSVQAAFIAEQNAFDRLAIDVNRDGVTGSGAGGGADAVGGAEEFFEFVNTRGSSLLMNNWVFKDTNGLTPTILTDTTTTSYDFAFGASTGISLANNQALVVTAAPFTSTGATFSPRNFGGSLVYTKAQSFVTTSLQISNGSSLTGRTVTFDSTLTSIGIGTTNDAIVAYEPGVLSPLASVGPSLTTAASPQASYSRTGDLSGGTAIAHPLLGSTRTTPGLKSDGSSWNTPEQSVLKISGVGTLTGANNVWNLDFGTALEGATISAILALENSAGLGGILSAVGDDDAIGDVTILSGASQILRLMGGESTNNYGSLGTINGFNYSDSAFAENLEFTIDTSTPGLKTGTYSFLVRDGFGIVNGANSSPLLEGGTLTINFSANIQPIPEPSTMALGGLGLIGLVGYSARRRRAKQA